MQISDHDLEAATQAYLSAALGQDSGASVEDASSLRDSGYSLASFLPEAVDAVREDVAALAWVFRDEIESVSPKTLANLLWFERSSPDGTLEPGLDPDLARRLAQASLSLGGLDFWPADGGRLSFDRSPPFDAPDLGDAMREAAKAPKRRPRP